MACQGVGGAYTAALATNTQPGGTSQAAINASVTLFNQAVAQCPNTTILASGYSQGAAVMHGTAKALTPDVRARVAAVQVYGDTQNKQNNGTIPPFPTSQTLVICNANDGVCGGQLDVTAGHLEYTQHVGQAVTFLASRAQGNVTAH